MSDLNWKRSKLDGIIIYTAKTEFNNYEIRNWGIDESGDGKYQVCINDYHKENFHTLNESKDYCDECSKF